LKSEFKVKNQIQSFQVLFSVDRLTQSGNFENLLESNQTTLPKEKLFLITSSASVQIYKNYGGQQVIFSRVQTELINSVSSQDFFSGFSLTFFPLCN
jgi:hypothetical protein